MSSFVLQLKEQLGIDIARGGMETYLELVDLVESCLKIRDYFIVTYSKTEVIRYRHLAAQFSNMTGYVDFMKRMREKKVADMEPEVDGGLIDTRTILDLGDLLRNGKSMYLHFSFDEKLNGDTMSNVIDSLRQVNPDIGTASMGLVVFHVMDFSGAIKKSIETRYGNLLLGSINNHGSRPEFYVKTIFPINRQSNNVYFINKILVARETLREMIEVRGYSGKANFIYYNRFSEKLGHFNMDLDSRFERIRLDCDLDQKNYFDIYGIFQSGGLPIYINFFITDHNDNIHQHISKLEPQIRKFLRIDAAVTIYLIVITNKKIKEEFGMKASGNKGHDFKNMIVDIMLLDNLQCNPIKNYYQPKFRLIKKKTAEHAEVIRHYGVLDSIPKMKITDPVNKFFGGEHNDIYEIIRPQHIKINNERNTQLHMDVTYRIVR